MLNKPKFLTPSTNMSECTIDINSDIINFSCIVDGNEAINAWQIVIYRLDDAVEVLNTGKQELSAHFFPVDEKNRNNVFTIDIKPYISEASEFINSISPYFWTISFWGTSGTTSTSYEEVFYANSSPTIKIQYGEEKTSEDGVKYIDYIDCPDDNLSVVLNSRKYFFKAIYEQNEAVQLKRYGWRLIDVDNDNVIIDTITCNQIYGVADNIICSYDGFLNDANYSLEVFVETQNNYSVLSSPVSLSTSYETTFLTNDFKVELLRKEAAVILDWSNVVVIGGHPVGKISYKKNYPIVDNGSDKSNTSVVIPEGSYIEYDYGSNLNLDISETSYIALSTQLITPTDRVLFSAEGKDNNGYDIIRKLSFADGSFIYSILGSDGVVITKSYTPKYPPNEYVWYTIVMSPILIDDTGKSFVSLKINESIATGGLYPSDNLYPSEGLYPSFGVWELEIEGGE